MYATFIFEDIIMLLTSMPDSEFLGEVRKITETRNLNRIELELLMTRFEDNLETTYEAEQILNERDVKLHPELAPDE